MLGFKDYAFCAAKRTTFKRNPVLNVKDNTTSVYNVLTMARFMKIHLNNGIWQLCKTRTRDLKRMKKWDSNPEKQSLSRDNLW